MIELDLGRFRRARVWLKEFPDAEIVSAGTIGTTVPSRGESSAEVERACVELVIPRGARIDYGLLGAWFVPTGQGNDVEIVVDYSDGFGSGRTFDSGIAIAPERAVVGLPKELADSVRAGATAEAAEAWNAGPGELRFGLAAHGIYGSSERLFVQLARLVVVVLRSATTEEQELTGLFSAVLSA